MSLRPPLSLCSLLATVLAFPGTGLASDPFLTIWKYSGESSGGNGHVQNLQLLDLRRDPSGKLTRSESLDFKPMAERSGQYYRVEKSRFSAFDIKDHSSHELHNSQFFQMKGGVSYCHDILKLNQDFPLNQMIERNVISEGMRASLEQDLLFTDPDRVTFFETIQVMDRDEVMRKYGKVPSAARRNDAFGLKFKSKSSDGSSREFTDGEWTEFKMNHPKDVEALLRTHEYIHTFDVKTSSVVAIAGQTPKGNFDLPLVNGLDGSVLKKPVDREKYPMIWEIGRLATVNAADIPLVMESLVLQLKSEAAVLGHDLPEGGMLFAHAPDAAHARLYQSNSGMKQYSGYAGNDHEAVLVISIKDFAERLKLKGDFGAGPESIRSLRAEMIETNRYTAPFLWERWRRKIEGYFIRDFSGGERRVPLYGHHENQAFRDELAKMKAISFGADAHALHDHLANLIAYQEKFGLFRNAENILVQVSRQGDHSPEFTPEIAAMVKPSAHKVHYAKFYYWSVSDAKKYVQEHPEIFDSLIRKVRESITYDPADLTDFWKKPLAGT